MTWKWVGTLTWHLGFYKTLISKNFIPQKSAGTKMQLKGSRKKNIKNSCPLSKDKKYPSSKTSDPTRNPTPKQNTTKYKNNTNQLQHQILWEPCPSVRSVGGVYEALHQRKVGGASVGVLHQSGIHIHRCTVVPTRFVSWVNWNSVHQPGGRWSGLPKNPPSVNLSTAWKKTIVTLSPRSAIWARNKSKGIW